MKHFEPRTVNLGFILFWVLFSLALVSEAKWASLVVVFLFASVFAYAYYSYFEDPERNFENEQFMARWRERVEQRWQTNPPLARNLEYYLRATPEGSLVGIVVVITVALILLSFVVYVL
jgi:hypothetical protein